MLPKSWLAWTAVLLNPGGGRSASPLTPSKREHELLLQNKSGAKNCPRCPLLDLIKNTVALKSKEDQPNPNRTADFVSILEKGPLTYDQRSNEAFYSGNSFSAHGISYGKGPHRKHNRRNVTSIRVAVLIPWVGNRPSEFDLPWINFWAARYAGANFFFPKADCSNPSIASVQRG